MIKASFNFVVMFFFVTLSSNSTISTVDLSGSILPNDTDYRNQFTGFYSTIIYKYTYSNTTYIYDTIETIMTIDKFHGYTTPTCSNYYDTIHKLAFVWGPYGQPLTCNNWCYYVHGFIHPTVYPDSMLEYPEFMYGSGDSFVGYFFGDSVYVDYYEQNIMYGYGYTIKGKKDSVLASSNTRIHNSLKQISFYPNPAKNDITFSNIQSTRVLIKLYNSSGKQLINKEVKNQDHFHLDISDLPTGIYLVKIQTDSYADIKRLIKL